VVVAADSGRSTEGGALGGRAAPSSPVVRCSETNTVPNNVDNANISARVSKHISGREARNYKHDYSRAEQEDGK
jgi:hypothetical protein